MKKLNGKNLRDRRAWSRLFIRSSWLGVFLALAIIAFLIPHLPLRAAVEGDGRILYGEGVVETPRTLTYSNNNVSYSSESSLPTAGASIQATIMEAAPTRDEMIAGVVTSSNQLVVYRWNGSVWSNEWSVTLPATHIPSFDIAYEQVSGDAMIIYSRGVGVTNELAYRMYNGTSWAAAVTLDATATSGTVQAVVAESRPETDELAVAWADSNLDLSANYWTGSTWVGERDRVLEANLPRINKTDPNIQNAVFDVAFEQQGGEVLIAWGEEGVHGINFINRNVGPTGEWGEAMRMLPTSYEFMPMSVSLAAEPASDVIAISMEGEFTYEGATSWRFQMGMWSGESWDVNGSFSNITPSGIGEHRHDVTWMQRNGQVRALFMYDVDGHDGLAYRLYNKNDDTYTGSLLRSNYSVNHTQVRLMTNPHNQAEFIVFAVGTDNALTIDHGQYDEGSLRWHNATIEASIANPTLMAGWSASYAYNAYIPVQPPVTPAALHGSLFYIEGTGGDAPFRHLTLADDSWTTAASLPGGLTSSTKEQLEIKTSPVRNEKIAVTVNASGVLSVHRWDGVAWRDDWSMEIGVGYVARATVVYEQVSGRALVIYSRNVAGTNELGYRIWDGVSWGAAQTYDSLRTSGTIEYVTAETRRDTNEIAVAWADSNLDLSANYWTGSTWAGERSSALETNLGMVTSGAATIESPIVDLAFEGVSGELLIVWGHDTYTTTDANINHTLRRTTRTAGSSGVWSGMIQSAFNYNVRDVVLRGDVDSDYISMIYHSNGRADGTSASNVVRMGYWTGTGWAALGTLPIASTMGTGESDVASAWLSSGGQSIALYFFDRNTSASDGLHYTWYNRTTNAWKHDEVGGFYRNSSLPIPTYGKKLLKLVNNPNDASQAMVIAIDDNNDLFIKKVSFNGTSINISSVEDGGVVMSSDITSTASMGWKADFAYQYDIAPLSTLGVDIVNASGFSVADPAVTMVGVATGASCQTTTGIFGTNSQSIRVENTTATPGWSVSLAPSAGAATTWSSETAAYDFNDAAGSPAGCGDGGDADSVSGQLRVNPSAGSLTAKGGCTTTGVSRGSSSAFSQGSIDAITLMSATSGAATGCYWDLTGVALEQTIPALQAAGRYTITMMVTAVAN